MMNRESLKSGDDQQLFISAQNDCESLKEKFFELYILYSLSKNLNIALQLEDLFSKTMNLLKDLLKIEDFCFMLLDEKCNELRMWKASTDLYERAKDVTIKAGEGISGIVLQTGEPILISNVNNEVRFLFYKGTIPDIGSFLSVPLKLSNNKIIGVLNIQKREINAFRESDKILFCAVAQNIAHTIERSRCYEKAQKESMFDDLTALYTRRYFIDSCSRECSKAERYGRNFSIIIADIDYFKYINDTYGHAMGDELLKKLASVLKANVRQGDVICRYGGEEFAILLPGIDKDGSTIIAEKLRSVVERGLSKRINVNKDVTITAGVATYPEDGKTVKEIIAMADKFLYLGKESGRNKIVNTALDTVLSKRDEKRTQSRYKTALKIARGTNNIQSIEIKVNDKDWKICAIRDVSKKGFKGELEFDGRIDYNYICKVIMDVGIRDLNIFPIRIVHADKFNHGQYNRYLIGAEIADEHDRWEKLFHLLMH